MCSKFTLGFAIQCDFLAYNAIACDRSSTMSRYQQPAYDLLSGAPLSPIPQRQTPVETFKQSTLNQSTVSRADHGNEDLRAQLRTLQYELDSIKNERELATLEQQQEIRDAHARAETDFKRAQAAESARDAAVRKADALSRDFQEVEGRAANEKLMLEKKMRGLQDDNRGLREELEEAQTELAESGRNRERAYHELESRYDTLRQQGEEAQRDLAGKVEALERTQRKLANKEAEAGELENEVLRLKAQTGDQETLAVIKKELGEQVEYIRRLEGINREQSAELKALRKTTKSVEVVEEEKRGLEGKLRVMEDLRRELAEAQLQKRILEGEKKGWTSYLESEGDKEDLNFETPEQMARAFLQERLERLSLVDKLGAVQPELSVREENIRSLEEDKARLQTEMEQLRASTAAAPPTAAAPDAKARARLERQKNLAVKEVEYLRAQMKTFQDEEAEFNAEQVDEEHNKRINELESMLEQYRSELQTLHADLSKLEAQPPAPATPSATALLSPRKRSREDEEEADQVRGEFRRKMRTLQDELSTAQNRTTVLEAELKASASQLTSLKESSRTRVLELRSNPTADAEAIKLATLRTLREENAALLAQVEGKPNGSKVVPVSTMNAMKLTIDELKQQIAQMEKKTLRLKQIFSTKSLEFREAVASILGWKLDFMPNGRVKCTSILYPTRINEEGDEEENSITFDGENGTMKVSGGPKSVFAGEIRELVEFWVEGKKEVVCLLAALTLEFYDKTTKGQS